MMDRLVFDGDGGGAGRPRVKPVRRLGVALGLTMSLLAAGLGVQQRVLASGNELTAGSYLLEGSSLVSTNGDYTLAMQTNGDLVLSIPGKALWSTGTANGSGYTYKLQLTAGGDLVLWQVTGTHTAAAWSTSTSGTGTYLEMQFDGNAVLYNSAGAALWASNTPNCTDNNICAPASFSDLVTAGVAAPADSQNEFAIETWGKAEGGGAGCPGQPAKTAPWTYSAGPAGNPLNTTEVEPGDTVWNSDGVKIYHNASGHTCWYWGVTATTQTLLNGYYAKILAVLRSPASTELAQCDDLGVAVGETPWGTGNFSKDC
jgi:hypothetical protein